MRARTAKLLLTALLTCSLPAAAEEPEVIDLFEGQSTMKVKRVRVEGVDTSDTSSDAADDSYASVDGGFTLRYEQQEGAILVPATVDGQSVYMLFDTGATYTTIDVAFARRAGILPSSSAPSANVATANGTVAAKFGLINSLVLGGRNHGGVTYITCTGCPSGVYKGKPIVGLLGMNVIGRYRTSFEHSKGVIEMTPASDYSNRLADVEPWIELGSASVGAAKAPRSYAVLGSLRNRSKRAVRELVVRYDCGSASGSSKVSVSPGKRSKFRVLVKQADCTRGIAGSLAAARW